jgi:hypothetical protein
MIGSPPSDSGLAVAVCSLQDVTSSSAVIAPSVILIKVFIVKFELSGFIDFLHCCYYLERHSE